MVRDRRSDADGPGKVQGGKKARLMNVNAMASEKGMEKKGVIILQQKEEEEKSRVMLGWHNCNNKRKGG
jgi:hypothetical protein